MSRNPLIGLILSLVMIMAINVGASFLFQNILRWNYILSMCLTDLILAFVFAIINYYNGPRLLAFKDPRYHTKVLIYFLFLLVFDLLFFVVF